MKILDKYILGKYFKTLALVISLLLPITIAIDVAEKADKFIRTGLPLGTIIRDYYLNFILFFGNTFLPLALFIAVIFFTSQMANNTEVIAIHSAKISFKRFLKPYLIGATIVAIFALMMNHFIVPRGNKTLESFTREYLKRKKVNNKNLYDINLQLAPNNYVFMKSFYVDRNKGYNFSYEKYDNEVLKYKLLAESIQWNKKDSTFTLLDVKKRYIGKLNDSIFSASKMDTIFNFFPKDLVSVDYMAKEMTSQKLYSYIKRAEKRGVSNLNSFWVELHKRTSLPISAYILTIIAVVLSSRKKRGGMGINLAVGITLMFIYIFFLKVGEVLGAGAEAYPLLSVWIPNLIFGILALYLYIKNAKK